METIDIGFRISIYDTLVSLVYKNVKSKNAQ